MQKTLEIIHTHTNVRTNKLIKVGRHKVNTQKPVAFLYTNNEQSGMEIEKIGKKNGKKWKLRK